VRYSSGSACSHVFDGLRDIERTGENGVCFQSLYDPYPGLLCGMFFYQKAILIMKDHTSTMRKTIGWASLAYGAFTIMSVVGPILLERFWSRRR